jgi:chromosomal replication initiator protein
MRSLERELPAQDFNTWIRPLHAVEDADTLRLLAPNRLVMDWVKQHQYSRIVELSSRIRPQHPPQIVLTVGSRTHQTRNAATSLPVPTHISRLNTQLTFTNFIQGRSNQVARAASLQVAETGVYNPLFIYGGVGLGKTHLMHAVGNHILAQRPDARILYVHSEQFVSDMVKALHQKKMNEFKRQYRSVDALLIDDVQFFAHKAQSQEELFHTINVLLDSKKQIVLTCDRLPQQLEGVDERLKSRFGWGLAVTVAQPDLETRLAILMAKAALAQIALPHDVGYFIAKHIHANVRELEGALHRLIMTAKVMHQNITLENTKMALKDLITFQMPALSLDLIQKAVAEYFKISLSDLCSRGRKRTIARPRQIAMTLSKELTQHSLPEIGSAFGGRDHTTVIYSCKTISKLKNADQQLSEDYSNLLKRLSA